MEVLLKRKEEIRKRNAQIEKIKVCSKCGEKLDEFLVCSKCGYHERLSAKKRIDLITDNNSFKEFDTSSKNFSLKYNYKDKYEKSKNKTKIEEAVICGICKINNIKVVICVMDSYFMMGTLGITVGENIAKSFEYATKHKLPIVIFTASGGARIQEGMHALVQMAKIDAVIKKHKEKKLPFISCLTNPTLGGVSASFGLVGDINIAEVNTTIGFAGKSIIKDLVEEEYSSDFQSEEYNLNHGMIDIICKRYELKDMISKILNYFKGNNELFKYENYITDYTRKNPHEVLEKVRDINRYKGKDYLINLFDSYIELHGDRISYDDNSIICGFGNIDKKVISFIIQSKGRTTKENLKNNYGMTRPEGYRKALRVAKLAEEFNIPILILIDSPGANPSVESEDNGCAIAISECMMNLLSLKTPIISIVVGEGCSGGALGLSTADFIAMFSNSMYSVISPEAYNEIIYKNKNVKNETLEKMHFTAIDLYNNKLIDEVLKEGTLEFNVSQIKNILFYNLKKLETISKTDLVNNRFEKIRHWDRSDVK